jgi:hypothetical protein
MSDEAEWRFPQGINDEDSLANWTWDEVLKAEQSEKQSACQENSPDKA